MMKRSVEMFSSWSGRVPRWCSVGSIVDSSHIHTGPVENTAKHSFGIPAPTAEENNKPSLWSALDRVGPSGQLCTVQSDQVGRVRRRTL